MRKRCLEHAAVLYAVIHGEAAASKKRMMFAITAEELLACFIPVPEDQAMRVRCAPARERRRRTSKRAAT